ncbi:hypothetical protein Pst134EB_020534 [Puccinia striiformis f. sp. tritici]|nr:hypothetical protein Pst134EB_020534 [Puccinia striiformis f. sp. tritici]
MPPLCNSRANHSSHSMAGATNTVPFPLSVTTKPESESLRRPQSMVGATNTVPFPLSEMTRLENMYQRFERACQSKDYRKLLRRESRKDLYLNTQAKIATLKKLIRKKLNMRTIVEHPRICLLRGSDDSAPLKLLGTLPVPSPIAQGRLPPRPASFISIEDDEDNAERLRRLISELDLIMDPP